MLPIICRQHLRCKLASQVQRKRIQKQTTGARHLSLCYPVNSGCLYSQHFKGSENRVADALSRCFDLTDNQLEFFVHSTLHYQVQSTFRVVQLPPSIHSWVIWLLQRIKGTTALQKVQEIKNPECGNAGLHTAESSRIIVDRRRQFSKPDKKELGAGTISETLA